MIDIHNHLLPGIDDGCKDFDMAIKALKEVGNKGITKIILTPHYIKGSHFACNNKKKKELLEELQNQCQKQNIKIELYLGNEIYFDNDIDEFIKNEEAMTLNNSKYLLFELPMGNRVNNLKEVIFKLRNKGFIPIIAHPERYTYIQENPEELISLIEQGCLFQGNLGSLVGIYGKHSKKCLKILLKHNLIHFMASDIHHPNSKNILLLEQGIKELDKLIGQQNRESLIVKNPLNIINNQEIRINNPKKFKSFFKFF